MARSFLLALFVVGPWLLWVCSPSLTAQPSIRVMEVNHPQELPPRSQADLPGSGSEIASGSGIGDAGPWRGPQNQRAPASGSFKPPDKNSVFVFSHTGTMDPVVFSHRKHGNFEACEECHDRRTNRVMPGGASESFHMAGMLIGRSCGRCHNGQISFSVVAECKNCHRGKK